MEQTTVIESAPAKNYNSRKDSDRHMFASFLLGNIEVALRVEDLQEVANFPERISRVPLAPDYLIGLFTLRDLVIPLINTSQLLDIKQTVVHSNPKIAVVNYANIHLGLLFDATEEVLTVTDDQISRFAKSDANEQVVTGSIKLENGNRLVQIIEPNKLLNVTNIPKVLDGLKDRNDSRKRRKAKDLQCISFAVGDTTLAFSICAIQEIIRPQPVLESVLKYPFCVGMINLRGSTIPLIDLGVFLGLEGNSKHSSTDQRVIICRSKDARVGFLVDAVENSRSFYREDILPIPVFNKDRADAFDGLLVDSDGSQMILLDVNKIFSTDELEKLTSGTERLYKSQNLGDADERKARSVRKNYLSFKLLYEAAVPLNQVEEILSVPDTGIVPPGSPDFVVSVTELRGKVITLISLRKFYGIAENTEPEHTKVLVVESPKGRLGLLVDSVNNIVPVDESQKRRVPQFGEQRNGKMQSDMKEILQLDNAEGKKCDVMIFDMPSLVAKLCSEVAGN